MKKRTEKLSGKPRVDPVVFPEVGGKGREGRLLALVCKRFRFYSYSGTQRLGYGLFMRSWN